MYQAGGVGECGHGIGFSFWILYEGDTYLIEII